MIDVLHRLFVESFLISTRAPRGASQKIFQGTCNLMKNLFLVIALSGIMAGSTAVQAQEFNPDVDCMYTSAKFNALLKFDINDQLQNVYFSTGAKWLEYEIVEAQYLGDGKGWIYKFKDGMGNQYTIKRPSLDANVTLGDAAGKSSTLTRKK
jgi:hypothetical protein